MGDRGIPDDLLYLRPRGFKWVIFSVVCGRSASSLCCKVRLDIWI